MYDPGFVRLVAQRMFDANERKYRTDCGSYIYSPRRTGGTFSLDLMDETTKKQETLYEASLKATNALEIGTYMGHSLLIMLCANPKLKVTTIDKTSVYCAGALNVLREVFPQSSITFIEGMSVDVLPTLTEKYDLFHIDGEHKSETVINEIRLCDRLFDRSKRAVTFVLDDLDYVQQARSFMFNNYKLNSSGTKGGQNYNWKAVVSTASQPLG